MASRGAKAMAWTKPSNWSQCLAELREQALDLRVVGDIAVERQPGAELGRDFGHALFEALALVAERQFGSFAVAGTGNAISHASGCSAHR